MHRVPPRRVLVVLAASAVAAVAVQRSVRPAPLRLRVFGRHVGISGHPSRPREAGVSTNWLLSGEIVIPLRSHGPMSKLVSGAP
jgi:hypothetical protein